MSDAATHLDLRPDHRAIVREILQRHVPDRKVLAFGSRATWTAKDYSDLDLAILGDEPLSLRETSALAEDFGESDLPFKVDLVDCARIDEAFRSIIRRDGVAVQVPKTGRPVPVSSCRPPPTRGKSATRNEWNRAILDDVIDLTLSSVDKKTKSDEKRVILCNYMDVYNNSFIHADMDFMTATATEREITKCSLFAEDVIITKDSEKHDDIGVPALVRQDIKNLVCGYHLAILRPRLSKIDGTYLFYALKIDETQRQFHSYANGVTRFGLRKADIGLVEIPLPPLADQKSIAHVLSTLDDRVELNRRMNETLEATARTIFKDWFVDFGPVRAKMEGLAPYLASEFWNLFPDTLDDEGKPLGWKCGTFGEYFRLTMGQSPPGSTYNDHGEGLPFFQGRKDFGLRYPENRRYCTAPARIAASDDTLVSVRAPVGDINMAWEKCCAGRGIAVLRHKSGARSFTYYSAQAMKQELEQYEQTGTVFDAINQKSFRSLRSLEPLPEIVELFEQVVGPLDDRIRNNVSENRTLVQARDLLLPKLMSGEILLCDAERLAEEIA